jgi:hypothetical protein
MSVISELISGLAKPVVDLIDDLHTSGEEKLKAKQHLTKLFLDAEHQAADQQLKLEGEITARHKQDMTSDSWLSKNIRPAILVFLTGMYVIISWLDGNLQVGEWLFVVKAPYVTVYENLLLLAYSFYFGGRSLEKGAYFLKKR